MKKLIAILLAIAMCMIMAGCGAKEETKKTITSRRIVTCDDMYICVETVYEVDDNGFKTEVSRQYYLCE